MAGLDMRGQASASGATFSAALKESPSAMGKGGAERDADVESQTTREGTGTEASGSAKSGVLSHFDDGCPQLSDSNVVPENQQEGEEKEPYKGFPDNACLRRRCCCFSAPLALVVVGTALGFLWPRQPKWSVQRLEVNPKDVTSLVSSITTPGFNETFLLPVNTSVEIWNPNYVGAAAGDGHFVVSFGPHVLAEVETGALSMGPRQNCMMVAHSESSISPTLSQAMLKALASDFRLQVDVNGHAPAEANLGLFRLPMKVKVRCQVDVNVLALVNDPDKLVVGHKCKYSYHLAK